MDARSDIYSQPAAVAVVEVTNRCNLRCPHCASDSGCARDEEMTLEEMRRVISDLAHLGCRELALLGGELLLRPDWYDIARAVKEEGIELQIITNGLLVTEEVRRRFLSLDPQTIGVSLDGATPESYRAARGVDGFARCVRLLDQLVADGFREVHAVTTFTAKNLVDFDLFAERFADTPIVWQIQMAHRGGERFPEDLLMTREQFSWLVGKVAEAYERHGTRLKLMTMDDFGYFPHSRRMKGLCRRWNGCQAGRRVIGIRANGDVLPCLSLGDRFIAANLRRRPLRDIWRDPASFPGFRDQGGGLAGRCAKCPFAAECRAGCSAMAYSQTGTLAETSFCIRQLEEERMLAEICGTSSRSPEESTE